MPRNRVALLVLGASLAAVAITLLAGGCGGAADSVETPAAPAPPQASSLDWEERYPDAGGGLAFTVRSFAVTANGWTAEVGVANRSGVAWSIEVPESARSSTIAARSQFGVGIFPTGALEDLESASDKQRLPPVRQAETFVPDLPDTLGPGEKWDGTMKASGRLPAGLWVRLAFGPFWALDTPPKGMQSVVSWYTDHAIELHP